MQTEGEDHEFQKFGVAGEMRDPQRPEDAWVKVQMKRTCGEDMLVKGQRALAAACGFGVRRQDSRPLISFVTLGACLHPSKP